MLSLCLISVLGLAHVRTEEALKAHQGLGIAAQALSYALTLLAAWWLFARIWDRPFLDGLEWNWIALRRRWYWVVLGAIAMSAAAQFSLRFITQPKTSPMDQLLRTTSGAWWMTAFGVLLAPLTEEIAFRGFLLPALATAYDWLMVERTPAGVQRWQSSTLHSSAALIFAAIFSSVPFALLHAGQLEHAWGALGILYVVSLILSIVRIRTHSVGCSVLMHAVYNLTVFTVLFVGTGAYRHMDRMLH
jgi:hypothetical protein